ncbi:hypothetical protein BT96DRAFT_193985 [Gymnopus androsaceus JB14]|uniref:Uncharacterized protein n=1 Tax=Gymnopus androsaceus JB14 TaxID=1447944 RepID=A0A6A4HB34_9AGAR|nr:hypothetical protein BT96DRAFT_193985 [Gymnopus androsaceus JB14]
MSDRHPYRSSSWNRDHSPFASVIGTNHIPSSAELSMLKTLLCSTSARTLPIASRNRSCTESSGRSLLGKAENHKLYRGSQSPDLSHSSDSSGNTRRNIRLVSSDRASTMLSEI